MTPAFENMLYSKYPKLYAQRYEPKSTTCMCYGFSHGDGWFKIIDELSAKLEAINETLPPEKHIQTAQVKEKFGTLRYYTNGQHSKVVNDLIAEAERLTSITCEKCGSKGSMRDGSYLMTLCDDCNLKKRK